MKTLNIVNVKTIFNISKPIVVYVTAQGIDVARTPKQALLDLQNSGRALDVPANAVDRGVANTSLQVVGAFKKALFGTIGATISGEINPFKAGDSFIYGEGHPALTDKSHELYNKVKLGDKGIAKEDGVWIDGFCSIPQSAMERQIDANAQATAQLFAQMFGMVAQAPQTAVTESYEDVEEEESPIAEALGNAKPAKA